MAEFMRSSTAQAVIWSAFLIFVIVVAYYGVIKLRDQSLNDRELPSDLLSKFSEMHQKGEISDDEFRNIKTKLAPKLQQGLKDSGDKGSNEPT